MKQLQIEVIVGDKKYFSKNIDDQNDILNYRHRVLHREEYEHVVIPTLTGLMAFGKTDSAEATILLHNLSETS